MKIFWEWVKNFDAIKAVVLAIVAIFTSWYDLKSEVKMNKVEAVQIKADLENRLRAQDKVDAEQSMRINQLHDDIERGFFDLRADIRSINAAGKTK